MSNSFTNGDLVVRNAVPSGDCPPDVYEFGFGDGKALLCIRCCLQRPREDGVVPIEIGPLIEKGVCEDCRNV